MANDVIKHGVVALLAAFLIDVEPELKEQERWMEWLHKHAEELSEDAIFTPMIDGLLEAVGEASASAPAQPVSSADIVMTILETGEWHLRRMLPSTYITDEGNRVSAWLVERQQAPYCAVYADQPGEPYGPRSWAGPTALEALQTAANDLGMTLPQPAAQALDARILNAGSSLANCAFNLAQQGGQELPANVAKTLGACRAEWDAAIAAKQRDGAA